MEKKQEINLRTEMFTRGDNFPKKGYLVENGRQRKMTEEEVSLIEKIEKEKSIEVYLVSTSRTEFGELVNLIYVSDYPEEWEDDRRDIEEYMPYAYVVNLTVPHFSEFGRIIVDPVTLDRVG